MLVRQTVSYIGLTSLYSADSIIIMNKVFGILLAGVFVLALVGADDASATRQFKDNDWTHPFFERCADKGGFALNVSDNQ